MRLSEILIFSVIAVVAIGVGAGLLWLLWMRFELGFDDSVAYSMIGLLFILPAVANFGTLLAGSEENGGERICAGVRGVGMSMCGIAVGILFLVEGAQIKHAAALFILGTILWWGVVPFEDRFTMDRIRKR